jgi:hypothetical protein
MQTTEPRVFADIEKGKSCAAHPRSRPARYRGPADGRRADDGPEPPLRYEVESLQHWLDLNA